MTVKVYPYREKVNMGNIIWAERDRGSSYYRVSRYAMRNGRFPGDHPCAPGKEGHAVAGQIGVGAALDTFRARGYWASCVPEGDGIMWKPLQGQTDAQCLADIRECFGWELELRGPWEAGA